MHSTERGPDSEPPSDLTLQQAAELYAVSARTLAQHIRCGQLSAYKTSGATAREWRVTREALDAAGYPRRQAVGTDDTAAAPLVAQLRREVDAARRAAAAERRRADDIDRRLGQALLECGHLRNALATATGAEAPATELHLDGAQAKELVDDFRSARKDRQLQHEQS